MGVGKATVKEAIGRIRIEENGRFLGYFLQHRFDTVVGPKLYAFFFQKLLQIRG